MRFGYVISTCRKRPSWWLLKELICVVFNPSSFGRLALGSEMAKLTGQFICVPINWGSLKWGKSHEKTRHGTTHACTLLRQFRILGCGKENLHPEKKIIIIRNFNIIVNLVWLKMIDADGSIHVSKALNGFFLLSAHSWEKRILSLTFMALSKCFARSP